MSPELVTILMFASLFAVLLTGLPIAFSLGFVAIIFAFYLWGPESLLLIASSMSNYLKNFLLVAIPLFIFMANMLERAGIADDLYSTMHKWFGPVRGGLAIGTVVICTIFAAMSGISSTGTITMGLIALPAMLKRGYDKSIAIGCILAGGALGILIPPSISFIIYVLFANVSVGALFMAGILPGILLSTLFIAYIAIRCYLQPSLGPSLAYTERAGWGIKIKSLRAILLPLLLVIAVLGAIFTGIATPTEAAAVGAFGSIICAIIYGRFNREHLKYVSISTLRTTSMLIWIMGGAYAFSSIYTGLGATEVVNKFMRSLQLSPLLIILAMQVSLFFLGMFLDPMAIMMITLPIYLPIVSSMGYSLVWFGVLFTINMEMGFLTPPFGFTLFIMRGIAPKGVTVYDIYKSIWPFVALQGLGLIIVMIFPQIALYLPSLLG